MPERSSAQNSRRILLAHSVVLGALAAALALVLPGGAPLPGDRAALTARELLLALTAALVAAALLLAWNVVLRRSVRLKTAELEEGDEIFRLYMESSPVYTYVKDEELRAIKLSRNFEKMLQRPLEEILGKGTRELFPPELAAGIEEADRSILRDGRPVELDEELEGRIYHTIKFPIKREGKPSYLAGYTIDVTERRLAERGLERSLREKETLLRELNHRTKNTMQVIRSLLLLQALQYPDDPAVERVVRDAEDRIQAISLVHQLLYESRDLSRIPMAEYIRGLVNLVMESFATPPSKVALRLEAGEARFLLDAAIPFGLVLNELASNSLRHGFPGDRRGSISISLEDAGEGSYVLRYSDDGVGVPDGFDFRGRGGLGLKLVHSLGEEQLKGKVEMSGGEGRGVSCVLRFRSGLHKARV